MQNPSYLLVLLNVLAFVFEIIYVEYKFNIIFTEHILTPQTELVEKNFILDSWLAYESDSGSINNWKFNPWKVFLVRDDTLVAYLTKLITVAVIKETSS